MLYIQSQSLGYDLNYSMNIDIDDYFLKVTDDKLDAIHDYRHAIEQDTWFEEKLKKYETRVFLKKHKFQHLFIKKQNRFSKRIYNRYKIENEFKGWTSINIENSFESLIDEGFLNNNPRINFIRESPLIYTTYENETFNQVLEKYLGADVIIPYDLEKRKEKYPLAFKELSSYMKKYM